MSCYQLRLLGTFQLTREGKITAGFRSEKERALLAYLAAEANRPHSRDALAGLLWPELPEDTAHNNLRVTLHRLRRAVGDQGANPPLLEVSRESVQLAQGEHLWVDVVAFQELVGKVEQHRHEKLATCPECMTRYSEAVGLYRGDFLQGIYPADSLSFSEWALLKREHLHAQALHCYYLLAGYHQRRGELHQALEYAWRQLELEPWREEAHCQVMTILALHGERSAALRQYERCRQVLSEELGVEPAEETRAVYQRILTSRTGHRHNLPLHSTPFLGRKAELNRVGDFLADPDCRLLTILGPGGIGKSRLAAQVAESQIYTYFDGVYFIQLAGITDPESVPRAIARELKLQFHPTRDPKTQLMDYLREKEMLLVLDNYEQLLGSMATPGAGILVELLENAPDLRLLVTSRQRLNLNQERLFALQGLSFPRNGIHQELEKYEAVQLFLQSARRTEPGFQPGKDERPAIIRICQLLDGMPLAIELAAAWIRVMPPEQIALEIEKDLDFLASTYPDVPERQRSLRATFEHSFNLLTPEEQQVLCRLSVFPASFDRLAAEQVAGASLPILTSLCDRSLLEQRRIQNHGTGLRYRLHELIRQFSVERLQQIPAQAMLAVDQHCRYYMRFLNDRDKDVMGGSAAYQAVEEVGGEIENVRLALDRAITQGSLDELGHSYNILMFFFEIRGLFEEAERVFGKISRCMQEKIPIGEAAVKDGGRYLGRALMYHGWYCVHLGHFDQAIELTQKGLALCQQSGDQEGWGLGLNSLGVFAMEQGKYQLAKSYLQEGLAVLKDSEYPWSLAGVLGNLGHVAKLEGDLPHGAELYNRAFDLSAQLHDEWAVAGHLESLGDIALRQGNLELAEQRFRQGLAIREKLSQRWREVISLNGLGEVAYRRQQYADAKGYYLESLAILRDFGERLRLASTLARYGEACTALGENAHARESFLSALRLALEIGADGTTVNALLGMAELLAREGEREQAVEILVTICEHPSLEQDDVKKAVSLLADLKADLHPQAAQLLSENGKMKTMEDLVHDLMELAAGGLQPKPAHPAAGSKDLFLSDQGGGGLEEASGGCWP